MKHDLPQTLEEAKHDCSLLGFDLDEKHYRKMAQFMDVLAEHSKRANMIGPRETQRLWSRHVLESIAYIPFLQGKHVVDIGTGAGFPGLILAICGYDVTMIDSRQKRSGFLSAMVKYLEIPGRVIHGRFEFVGNFPSKTLFTCRAVKKPEEMIENLKQVTRKEFTLVTRVAHGAERISGAKISKVLPLPPLDREGFILQYRYPVCEK